MDLGTLPLDNASCEPIPTMLFNKEELLRILDHRGPNSGACIVEQVPSVDSEPCAADILDLQPTVQVLVDPASNPDIDVASEINVDEIYQVLGRDILKSPLLSDIDLYLECDEDSLYVMPKDQDVEAVSYRNRNVILIIFSLLATPKVVKLKIPCADND